MGNIESGVRLSLRNMNIGKPATALEMLAIELAKRLDKGVNDQSLAAVSQQLRLTLEQCATQPRPASSDIDSLIESQ